VFTLISLFCEVSLLVILVVSVFIQVKRTIHMIYVQEMNISIYFQLERILAYGALVHMWCVCGGGGGGGGKPKTTTDLYDGLS
jgi:hypothetical protein